MNPQTYAISLDELKRTATCDDDVVAWLQAHPETLPEVPNILVPHVNVMLANRGSLCDDFEDQTIRYTMYFTYEVTAPSSTSTDEFGQLFNGRVEYTKRRPRTNNDTDVVPCFSKTVQLVVPVNEWAYVTAKATGIVLDNEYSEGHPLFEVAHAAWPKFFPTIHWQSVKAMTGAGLTPADYDSFARWAVSSVCAKQERLVAVLPGELDPLHAGATGSR